MHVEQRFVVVACPVNATIWTLQHVGAQYIATSIDRLDILAILAFTIVD